MLAMEVNSAILANVFIAEFSGRGKFFTVSNSHCKRVDVGQPEQGYV